MDQMLVAGAVVGAITAAAGWYVSAGL